MNGINGYGVVLYGVNLEIIPSSLSMDQRSYGWLVPDIYY